MQRMSYFLLLLVLPADNIDCLFSFLKNRIGEKQSASLNFRVIITENSLYGKHAERCHAIRFLHVIFFVFWGLNYCVPECCWIFAAFMVNVQLFMLINVLLSAGWHINYLFFATLSEIYRARPGNHLVLLKLLSVSPLLTIQVLNEMGIWWYSWSNESLVL